MCHGNMNELLLYLDSYTFMASGVSSKVRYVTRLFSS